eukprot:m.31156 g.31156  ORF g.31156 m.31156 type:complete len:485 (-) comp13955_c0_seq1:186-1640(-)
MMAFSATAASVVVVCFMGLFKTMEAGTVNFVSAIHFQDLIRDTPYRLRPPTLMAFTNMSDQACAEDFAELKFRNSGLPDRRKLLIGRYDMEAQYSYQWFNFTEEMDLPMQLGVNKCNSLVMIPPEFTGRYGENDTLDHVIWDGSGDWKSWAMDSIATMHQPEEDPDWTTQRLSTRDQVETRTHMRISKVPAKLPMWTELGYKKLPMPDEMYNALKAFYDKHQHQRKVEVWDPVSTQLNFHESKMTMVSLDHDHQEKTRIANTYVRPLLSNWTGIPETDLDFRSFYGLREYYRGNELRVHLDVIKTHVISAILNFDQEGMDEDWPLEVINHRGERELITMQPREVILYESATLPHGRPFALKGDRFTSAFCHFQPKGWDFVEDTDGLPYSPTDYKGFGKRQVTGVPTPMQGLRRARFRNLADTDAKLFWQGTSGPVLQGAVKSGEDLLVDTFEGHKFFWSDGSAAGRKQEHTIATDSIYVHYDEM